MFTRREWLVSAVSGLAWSKASWGREKEEKAARRPAIFAFARSQSISSARNGGLFEIDPDDATWIMRTDQGNYTCRVSPSGEMAAYSTFGDKGGVYVQDLRGGDPKKTARIALGLAWSPDGSELIVGTPMKFAANLNTEPGTWTVNLKTGRETKLPIKPGIRVLDWSSDGKTLLATDEEDPDVPGALIALDLQGKNRRVLSAEKNAFLFDEHFSKDGRRAHYTFLGRNGSIEDLQAWTVDLDGVRRERLFKSLDSKSDPFQVRTAPDGRRSAAVLWSWTKGNDKKKVYDRGEETLVVVDADGGNVRKLELPAFDFIRLIDWV